MKKKNNLYNKITDLDVIMDMYDHVIRSNTKNKEKIETFENYYSENIYQIKDELAGKTYSPGKYSIFMIREPKLRVIMSLPIKDKIVNHLVAQYFLVDSFDNILTEYEEKFIKKGARIYMVFVYKN